MDRRRLGVAGVAEITPFSNSSDTSTPAATGTPANLVYEPETREGIKADIKNFKPVEPYKAKGIKERGQFVLRKEGKKK